MGTAPDYSVAVARLRNLSDASAPTVEGFFEHVVYLPVDGHLRERELGQLMSRLEAFVRFDSASDAQNMEPLPWMAPALEEEGVSHSW